jgi:hypothetical protein
MGELKMSDVLKDFIGMILALQVFILVALSQLLIKNGYELIGYVSLLFALLMIIMLIVLDIKYKKGVEK